jgi:predicted DNA binding CopG/RHH family protein
MQRSVQKFSDEYLQRCRELSAEEIVRFPEDFRRLRGAATARSRLISLKAPEPLLATFRAKARLHGVPYQTQIKNLMQAWLEDT